MIRKIIHIDEEKCNGCGACARACHESAIGMVNGKAKLLRDDYCDGLGDCLPACPTNAITFVEREAAAYDEAAVKANMAAKHARHAVDEKLPCGCPGTMARSISREESSCESVSGALADLPSRLTRWPVQIKLLPVNAQFFSGAHLLVAADCTAYAFANFHERFIKNRVALIGCPKLDNEDYSVKLSGIFAQNDIRSVKVVRMEVPCCGGIEMAVKKALENSGKNIPASVDIVSIDGKIISSHAI